MTFQLLPDFFLQMFVLLIDSILLLIQITAHFFSLCFELVDFILQIKHLFQGFITTGSLKFFLFLFDELSEFLYVSFQSFFQILGIGIQFLAFCKKIFFVFIVISCFR